MTASLVACAGPKAGPPPSTAERLNAESVRRIERGDDAGAEEIIREALREAELVDDLVGQAEAWNNLGALAMARGDPRQACSAHLTALALHQATRTRGIGEVRTRANLGAALLALGKPALAKVQFEEAVSLADRIGEAPRAGLARVGLAAVALQMGDAARALVLARGVAETPDNGDVSSDSAQSDARSVEGAAQESLGDNPGARASYDRALDIDRRRAAPRAVAEDLRSLARVVERSGDRREAAALLTRSARVAKGLGDRRAAMVDLEHAIELAHAAPSGETEAPTNALEAELRAMREARP